MIARALLRSLVVSLFVVGLVALARPSLAADRVSIRVDWFHWHYHSPFFLGIEKGFYKDAGIELTITEGRGSGQAAQLVSKKDDQFGFVAADAVVQGVSKGVDIINVATIMPKGAQAVVVLNSSPIKSPQDLKGKTMAYNPGGTQEALLPAYLEKFGMTQADLQIVSVTPAAKQQVFMAGKVDAMMSPSFSPSQYEQVGGARYFLYKDVGVQGVGYGIITHPDLVKNNPDLVRRFIAATLKSWEAAKAEPEASLDALAKHSQPNAKPETRKTNSIDFPAALAYVEPPKAGRPFGFSEDADWVEMQRLLMQAKVIEQPVAIDKLITNQFINQRLTN
ncbi:MAG: ABC transporter substrate-binding protein [Alphaproteobacteria bacterium]|nr:ABC transporter substrate-binding protein [Alphaproteobacteria bacterium]